MPKGGVPIGLKNVVYCLLIDDPLTGTATYDVVKPIAGAISAKVNPNSSNAVLFADDGPYETSSTVGEIAVDFNVADLPIEVQAELFGHTLAGGVLIRKSSDVPPYVALGYKSLKSNGKYRYTWLPKGKFAIPEQDNQTKGDSINYQTPTTSGSFMRRDCDEEWQRHIDADSTDFMPIMATNWFNNPYGGAGDSIPPTITGVVPANNATAIAVGASIVWTFNEALSLSSVNTSNFMVAKDTDGSAVAGSLSINAGRTQVTFTPNSALSAATAYRAIATVGVKDLSGNALAAASVTKFTTA